MLIKGKLASWLLVAIATGVLQGADVWLTKPVKEWTELETQKFLSSSPWVHEVVAVGLVQYGAATGMGYPQGANVGIGTGMPAPACPSCPPQPMGSGGVPRTLFRVQWVSAKIWRQAATHLKALQTGQQTEDVITEPLPQHTIVISGPDMSLFDGVSEGTLQANTCLRMKKSKSKCTPSRIEIGRSEGNKTTHVQFEFPREINGQPFLTADEDAVDFICKIGREDLKTTFRLNRMVTSQGRDL